MTRSSWLSALLLAASVCVACKSDPRPALGTSASALAPVSEVPGASGALTVQPDSSTVTFVMEAPFEKIYGEAPGSIDGSFAVNPHDLTRTRGLIRMDLDKLYLFQQKRADASSAYGEKVQNPKQNAHMKEWFGIDDGVPAAEHEKNRWAQFSVTEVKDASTTDLSTLSGASRKVTATLGGDVLVHGRKAPKSLRIEASFEYTGDHLDAVSVKSLTPLKIALKEHDIRPPDASKSEQVLQNWLGLFGKKVAEEAPIVLGFRAVAK
jgi:hypothetical protein